MQRKDVSGTTDESIHSGWSKNKIRDVCCLFYVSKRTYSEQWRLKTFPIDLGYIFTVVLKRIYIRHTTKGNPKKKQNE